MLYLTLTALRTAAYYALRGKGRAARRYLSVAYYSATAPRIRYVRAGLTRTYALTLVNRANARYGLNGPKRFYPTYRGGGFSIYR